MANLFMDGCEIDFADNSAGLWDGATVAAASATNFLKWASTIKRTGSGGVQMRAGINSNYAYLSKTIASVVEMYKGFGFYWDSYYPLSEGAANVVSMVVLASNTGAYQVTLAIDITSNVLRVFRGGSNGTLLGTGVTAVTADIQHYVEMNTVIHDTAGAITVRLNGNVEIAVTSVDTNTVGGDIVTIMVGVPRSSTAGNGGRGSFYYDDIIINDTTGTVSNSWPNGAGVEMLVPSADGNYTAWTSTGGAVDYTEIDDVTTYGNLPDDDTTTILSGTLDQRTSVALSNTVQVGQVEAVMLCTYAKNSAAGADEMAQGVRISTTDYDSATFIPATSYGWQKNILTLSPATSARWTTAEIDAMEMGWRRAT